MMTNLFFPFQVEHKTVHSAVYVNVAQLRQSVSESPPPSVPPSRSTSCLDGEGWEVHVDQESGQEFYYHPPTGRTTWDRPSPDSPPLSPDLSTSTASPQWAWPDWEQLVDASSGRPYFYNPMSGETSWEAPEPLSPYPATAMEPMSVHRFQEEQPVRTAPLAAPLSGSTFSSAPQGNQPHPEADLSCISRRQQVLCGDCRRPV